VLKELGGELVCVIGNAVCHNLQTGQTAPNQIIKFK